MDNILIWCNGNSFTINTYEKFKETIKNYKWFTYRINFPLLGDKTSDIGWGCTIRCAQMMICKALEILLPDRNHLLLFEDNINSPYSIHNLCSYKNLLDKELSDWIGPYTVCHLLKWANNNSEMYHQINIDIVENGLININNYESFPYIILIPIRLGLQSINDKYFTHIFQLFTNELFIGIIGGKKNSAYYMHSIDSNFDIYYLDPHFCQDISKGLNYQCDKIKKVNLKYVDPNMCFCFIAQNKDDILSITNLFNNVDGLPIKITHTESSLYNYEISNIDDDWQLLN